MLTANKKWKQSGTSLNFKDWLNREKEKGEVIAQKGVTDVYMNAIGDDVTDSNGVTDDKPNVDKKTILGLNKNILIFSGIIILGAVVYTKFYKK